MKSREEIGPRLGCVRIQWYLEVGQDDCALSVTCCDRVKALAQGFVDDVAWG